MGIFNIYVRLPGDIYISSPLNPYSSIWIHVNPVIYHTLSLSIAYIICHHWIPLIDIQAIYKGHQRHQRIVSSTILLSSAALRSRSIAFFASLELESPSKDSLEPWPLIGPSWPLENPTERIRTQWSFMEFYCWKTHLEIGAGTEFLGPARSVEVSVLVSFGIESKRMHTMYRL